MNQVIISGRLTRDPEVKTAGETTVAKYTIACDRRGKKDETDFISCVAFGKTAEFAEKYLAKGKRILITGRIQTGSYENKEGKKVYTTDVIVDSHEFIESKSAEISASNSSDDSFTTFDIKDADLPF